MISSNYLEEPWVSLTALSMIILVITLKEPWVSLTALSMILLVITLK